MSRLTRMSSNLPLFIFLLVQQLSQGFSGFRHATDKEADQETCHRDLVRSRPPEKSSHPVPSCILLPSAIAGIHANQPESDSALQNLDEEELYTA
jgi:hypothetical protein